MCTEFQEKRRENQLWHMSKVFDSYKKCSHNQHLWFYHNAPLTCPLVYWENRRYDGASFTNHYKWIASTCLFHLLLCRGTACSWESEPLSVVLHSGVQLRREFSRISQVSNEGHAAAALAEAVVLRSSEDSLTEAGTMAVGVARIFNQSTAALWCFEIEVAREAAGNIDAEAAFDLEWVIIEVEDGNHIRPTRPAAPWTVDLQSILLNVGVRSGLHFRCHQAAAAHIPVLCLVESSNGKRILSGDTGVSASQRVNSSFCSTSDLCHFVLSR